MCVVWCTTSSKIKIKILLIKREIVLFLKKPQGMMLVAAVAFCIATLCYAPPPAHGTLKKNKSWSSASATESFVPRMRACQGSAVTDEALLIEALTLRSLVHPAVLQLVGICTRKIPFLMVTEYMQSGDLKTWLRACRSSHRPKPKAVLTLLDVCTVAERMANALAFLEAVSVVHRDVAARNVLVNTGCNDAKLGDLGAARSVFRLEGGAAYTATQQHNPARWMAPESLTMARFTNKTDVWAFGVLLWECTTLAKTPYGAMTIRDMSESIKAGSRLEPGVLTPPGFPKLMKLCFNEDPKRRPNFAGLVQQLGAIRGAVSVNPEATIMAWG